MPVDGDDFCIPREKRNQVELPCWECHTGKIRPLDSSGGCQPFTRAEPDKIEGGSARYAQSWLAMHSNRENSLKGKLIRARNRQMGEMSSLPFGPG